MIFILRHHFYNMLLFFQVSEEDPDPSIEARNKSIDASITDKSTKSALTIETSNASSLSDNPLDDKEVDMKKQEDALEILKRKSEEASKTIERLKMQLQQQSDYELLKREVM